MKTPNWGITLVIIIILIAVFTNPTLEDHKQAVKSEINKIVQKSLSENNDLQNLGMLNFSKQNITY
ncbi:MAG: hypothetical protein EOO46_23020 [Flavobacterium sp.]|nr:MAG: hypothetical protein EOO46_23020 [Flavobacterium sp.]